MDLTIQKKLESLCAGGSVLFDEPLAKHTSFRIGGPADAFVQPGSAEELAEVIRFCDENGVKRAVIGNGTNLLASDEGFRGAVISICKNYSDLQIEGTCVKAQAGILLSALSSACAGRALTGFEFASGIPGTLGGAVTMNAGAYGGEMKDVLTRVTVYEPGKGVYAIEAKDLGLGYRTSVIGGSDCVVLSAELALAEGDPEKIRERIEELKQARTSKQPLEYPSAGSTFKRPEGYFAGKLIQDAGLAGYSIGGAQVSEKHCGFVINTGGATAADVKALMDFIIRTVEDRFGVTLEREVKFLEG